MLFWLVVPIKILHFIRQITSKFDMEIVVQWRRCKSRQVDSIFQLLYLLVESFYFLLIEGVEKFLFAFTVLAVWHTFSI